MPSHFDNWEILKDPAGKWNFGLVSAGRLERVTMLLAVVV
jgi:hypothetical protein